MRAFVAIALPEDVRENLVALAERLRAGGVKARWPRPENLHLTLRFLGDVTAAQAEAVARDLAVACAGTAPLRLAVRGTGAFPNVRRPSVVWAGVNGTTEALAHVQQAAESAAQAAGLAPEKKRFHPHVTLGRLRDPRRAGRLPALLEAERNFAGGEFSAGAVVLYESELRPAGAVYSQVHTIALAGEGN